MSSLPSGSRPSHLTVQKQGTDGVAGPSTISSDEYIRTLSRFIRRYEASLAAASPIRQRNNTTRQQPSSSFYDVSSLWTTPASWVGLGSTPNPIHQKQVASTAAVTLSLDPHHLYFLLLKFEEIGLSTGPLDIKSSATTRLTGHESWGRDSREEKKAETASIFSGMSSSISLGSSWWGGSGSSKSCDVGIEVKFLYSTFTKLPSLRLTPTSNPTGRGSMSFIDGFVTVPDDKAVPLHVFKNLMALEVEDLDPLSFVGWEKASFSLRKLQIKRSGLEDIEKLLTGSVIEDVRREEKVQRRAAQVQAEEERRSSGNEENGQESSNGGLEASVVTLKPVLSASLSLNKVTQTNTLPSLSWRFLRHLCLSDNSITFVPSEPLEALVSLNSLDLSSNLLIAIPNSLSVLTELRSLSVADNMIESVSGIDAVLGNVITVNLSRNRLSSLVGLDRLPAMEQVDLRHNRISDLQELSRLAPLPNLKHLWATSNPLCHVVPAPAVHWRISVFQYFVDEGRDPDGIVVNLDGSGPGFSERRSLVRKHGHGPDQDSAQILTDEGAIRREVVSKAHDLRARSKPESPAISGGEDGSSSSAQGNNKRDVGKVHRRRKPRIIDLDSKSRPVSSGTTVESVLGPLLASGTASSSDDATTQDQPLATPAAKQVGHARSPSHPGSSVGRKNQWEGTSSSPSRSATLGRSFGASPSRLKEAFIEEESQEHCAPPPDDGGHGDDWLKGGEGFRERVAALRAEVGDNWLRVLGESDLLNGTRASGGGNDEGGSGEVVTAGAQAIKVVRKKKGVARRAQAVSSFE